jgi:hypothetical protein
MSESVDKDLEILDVNANKWRDVYYQTRDELGALLADLLVVRREHVQVCDALRLKVTAYDTLRTEFERHVKESEQVSDEWLQESDALDTTGGNVIHQPRKLQTLPGARRAYAHAILHGNRLKETLIKTQAELSESMQTIAHLRAQLYQAQTAYKEQRHVSSKHGDDRKH